jgi:hypothetical protein
MDLPGIVVTPAHEMLSARYSPKNAIGFPIMMHLHGDYARYMKRRARFNEIDSCIYSIYIFAE